MITEKKILDWVNGHFFLNNWYTRFVYLSEKAEKSYDTRLFWTGLNFFLTAVSCHLLVQRLKAKISLNKWNPITPYPEPQL